jgi:type I restriction enzyme S subunit
MSNISLKEVSELITKGTTPSSVGCDFTAEGINFIKSESISDSKHLNNNVYEHIDENTDNKLKRSRLKEGDLLVSIAGAYLGKIAIVQESDIPANTNQAVGIVRLNKKIVNIDYIYYYFSQKHVNSYINKLSAQSSQPNLNLDLLGKLEFDFKDLSTQQRIASVLSALDSKIEVNNRINTELEAMAKTLYDYWFVQFDFPDKNGKPYKTSGGNMVWNEELKREIPEGWEVGTLGDVAELVRGVTYGSDDIKSQSASDVIPILRATNISGNVVDLNNMVYVSKQNVSHAQLLNKYDILITMSSGSKEHIGKNGFFYYEREASFGAFCAKIVAHAEYRYYLYSFTQSDFMFTTIKNECLGTNINNLNGSLVKGFKLIIPPNELINSFNVKANSVYEKLGNNLKENQKLTELRDWLLPMLMNGQVKLN